MIGALLGLALLAFASGVALASYTTADLQGAWEFNCIASGPGAPWWERRALAVLSDGSFAGTRSDNLGGAGPVSGVLGITSGGIVSTSELATTRGAMDANKTVMAMTSTWISGSPGTTDLRVGFKRAGTYGLSDLAGRWELNILASGPGAPWWQRGPATVASDGSFSGTFTDNLGVVDTNSGVFGITPAGILTISISSSGRGAMDAGRTVMAFTSTWATGSPGTTDLALGVKMAGAYSLADLAGTWEVNSLVSGPGAPWWQRGPITVASDGSFAGTLTENSGAVAPIAGVFNITPAGIVTIAGSSMARGALDAGKTVIVMTDVWSSGSPGTTEIRVLTRMSGGSTDAPSEGALAFALESARSNPWHGGALTVNFALPSADAATLELLDLAGRRIAACDVGSLGAGRHTRTLAEGGQLAPGLYFVRLRQGVNVRTLSVAALD